MPVLEFGAGVLLVIGLLTRVAAALLGVEMVFTGFVLKLFVFHTGVLGPNMEGGAELDFLYLAVFIVIFVAGPGRMALDSVLGLEKAGR